MLRNLFQNQKLNLFLGIPILVGLIVVGTICIGYIPNDEERQGILASHTRAIVTNLVSLLDHVTDAETGQRGYLLTGEESYLEPYNDSLLQIAQDKQQLRQLLADDPDQIDQLDQLDQLVDEKLAELKETINARKSGKIDEAKNIVLSGRGKSDMDLIRNKIETMQIVEQNALQIQHASWHQKSVEARYAIFVGTFALCLMIMVVLALLYREMNRRERI